MFCEQSQSSTMQSQLQSLRNRVLELEERSSGYRATGPALPAAPLSPANGSQERFFATITADNADGTYRVRRLIATSVNQFLNDPKYPNELTVGNVRECGSYAGMYSVGDIVPVVFDGLDSVNQGIYHMV